MTSASKKKKKTEDVIKLKQQGNKDIKHVDQNPSLPHSAALSGRVVRSHFLVLSHCCFPARAHLVPLGTQLPALP